MAGTFIRPLTPSLKLEMDRCPHCSVNRPNLSRVWHTETGNHAGAHQRIWHVYSCASCGGLMMVACPKHDAYKVTEIYPAPKETSSSIPERAREYLRQALESLHTPSGAIMLAASAVDSMLKVKGYREGTLNSRIDEAAAAHLITAEMGEWAHEIRLEANSERHADEGEPLPATEDAQRCLEFAIALAEFLFVLPDRVERGRKGPEKER